MSEITSRFPSCLEEAFQPLETVHQGELGVLFRVRTLPLAEDAPTSILRWFPRCRSLRLQERVLEQVKTLSALDIPGLVRFRGAGTTPEGAYVLMEEVQGTSILSPASALGPLEIARALADQLRALHARGMIHGDVRGENVLEQDGRVRLLGPNLGLEPRRMRGGQVREEDPAPTGFPQYLSPQLHFMKRAASEDDWFAWAVLVWHLIEGSPPFSADELAQSARLQKLSRVRPSRIEASSPLGEALRGCLVLVPQDRARTIAELPAKLAEADCPGRAPDLQAIPRLPLPERVLREAGRSDKLPGQGPAKRPGWMAILVLFLGLGALLWRVLAS